MVSPKSPLDDYSGAKSLPARLQDLAKAWQKFMEPALKHRQQLLRARASGYFDENYNRYHTLNLIDRGISTIVPFLVEGNPKVLVTTKIKNYRAQSRKLTLALNQLIQQINLAKDVLIPAATNAMVGAAITRTDFYYDRLISLDNEVIKLGSPRVELIDDSNYIGDVSAKRRSDFIFEGDIYTLPTEYAKDFFAGKDKFGNQIADYIGSDRQLFPDYNPRDMVGIDDNRQRFSLRDYTTFIDLYLRDENTIVTIMPKGKKAKILREREWEGPGSGPYDYLGFTFMPEVPIPIPPAWFWLDMDTSVNIIVDKMRKSAESQKDIFVGPADSEEAMEKALKTKHLGTLLGTAGEFETKSMGGIKDSSNWDFVNFLLMEQTKTGANPDILAGRGTQAPTFGQEQMLYNNATRVVGNMYTRYQDFMISIIDKLAWAFMTDPRTEVPVVNDIPGYGPLPTVFSSADKVGNFYDYVFDIVPHSTQRTSPEMLYQKSMQFLTQWVMPTLPMAMQQGAQLDIPTTTVDLAELAGLPSFNQYYHTAVPQAGEQLPYKMEPSTNRKSGQTSDAFGTTLGNQNGNLLQQQERTSSETGTK